MLETFIKSIRLTVISEAQHAIDNILLNGWTQHIDRNSVGKVCAVGALKYDLEGNDRSGKKDLQCRTSLYLIERMIQDFIYLNYDWPHRSWTSTTQWNDSPLRTEDEVIQMFQDFKKEQGELVSLSWNS